MSIYLWTITPETLEGFAMLNILYIEVILNPPLLILNSTHHYLVHTQNIHTPIHFLFMFYYFQNILCHFCTLYVLASVHTVPCTISVFGLKVAHVKDKS